MAYTAVDLAAVRAAILALVTGARVISVTFADRTVSYQQADLSDLRELEAQIIGELGTARPKQYLGVACKGL